MLKLQGKTSDRYDSLRIVLELRSKVLRCSVTMQSAGVQEPLVSTFSYLIRVDPYSIPGHVICLCHAWAIEEQLKRELSNIS